jgi:membrane protein DedA with SNARE-associated domain/rhodanese-related sulfurtransferase
MCLPVPAILFLISAGALAGSGGLSLPVALGLSITACLLADMVWYEAGRRWGEKILHLIYGLASDPDAAIRRSKMNFDRHGLQALMVSKFVVGLDAAAPPLAGLSGISRLRFIAFDTIGAALWSGAYAGLGYGFSKDLNRAASYASGLGKVFSAVLLAGLTIYVGRRIIRWHRFMREFRTAQITPEELNGKLETGETVVIIDLQGLRDHPQGYQGIPGAVRIDPHRLEQEPALSIPRDHEVILYCADSHEIASARVAHALHRRGFECVRPLAGGLRAWRERGFPLTNAI